MVNFSKINPFGFGKSGKADNVESKPSDNSQRISLFTEEEKQAKQATLNNALHDRSSIFQ